MKKTTYTNPIEFTFNKDHRGAPYCIQGKWCNHGEFCESVTKCHRHLDYVVNPTTTWCDGSDIESEKASVKSSGATLGCIYGESKDEILDYYFSKVPSTKWIYVVDIDEEINEYEMNAEEFREFFSTWGSLAKESGSKKLKLRLKKTTGKMVKWLEEKL